MLKIKKQLSKLYLSSVLGNLSLTGAWVAILAARGCSLPQIGLVETVFHVTSVLFELPSGILADVFGRKRMLMVGCLMRTVGNLLMILSRDFGMICVCMVFHALSYNFASGSGDALAYDSLKQAEIPEKFEGYESNQLILYRICGGISTLCAGLALFVGYKIAYGTDLLMGGAQLFVLSQLQEVYGGRHSPRGFSQCLRELGRVTGESFAFLRGTRSSLGLMLANSLVGALDILLLFFLQAKLTEGGIPQWGLGIALLLMELGGVAGARLILKYPGVSYRRVFGAAFLLVLFGILAEHSGEYVLMTLGGFLSAVGDDALQVRTNGILQARFPSEQRATLTSVESLTFSLIMIVLCPLAGIFFARW